MKRLSIIIFLISACLHVNAQCPPAGDITLTSQAEVDNFQTLYGSCPNLVVNGDLAINGSDISSLLPLAGLKEVTGNLELSNCVELLSLAGLESLEILRGGLDVYGNDKLTSLAALAKVTTVMGYLGIKRNLLLTSLQGLHNITSVGGELGIEENSELIDLDGLAKLETVDGNLNIISNEKLTGIGGLGTLSTVNGHVVINYNNELVSPGVFQELTGAVTSIGIRGNTKMKSLPGFPKLGEVYLGIRIMQCPELTGLAGLPPVKRLDYLEIAENAVLVNLNGLESLQEVIEHFLIIDNASLVDISGLSSLVSVGEMEISENHALETPGTLAEFTGGGEIDISNNSKMKYLPLFPKLVNYSGNIAIEGCPQLINLEGLSNLETVGGDLIVGENSLLFNLSGLEKLRRVSGGFVVNGNTSLTDISGLTALVSVGTYFEVSDNPELVTPGTLPEFTGDGDDIYLENNAKMKTLPNFPKLVSFSGYITMWNCPELVSLAGLSALKNFTGNLRILDNTALGTCAIKGICSLLSETPGRAWIANNATGCNSVEEVQEACETVLPVTLVNFSGKMNSEGLSTLAWSTASETNSDHFVIEHRSTPDEHWSAVGKVPAKRESRSLVTYDFIHNQPISGENLYRLKMVDTDLTFAYSRIISIRTKEPAAMYIFPNPVRSKLYFKGAGDVQEISVFDVGGLLRLKMNPSAKNEVDLENLAPGKYLLQFQTDDGPLHTQRVVKE